MNYSLLTQRGVAGPRSVIAVNGSFYDLAQSTKRHHWVGLDAVLAEWVDAEPILNEFAAGDLRSAVQVEPAAAMAPLQRPGVIFCAGANYKDHVVEMAVAQGIPAEPDPHDLGLGSWHFIKPARCIAAPGELINLPPTARKVDYEAELAVVIGKRTKKATVETAMSSVAAYMIANDLSARDLGKRDQVPDRSPFKYDWVAHKAFDQSCPLGPMLVPASSIADPQKLSIELWLNGEIRQRSNTSEMIFSIAEQIADLSHKLTLMPGDIILTGTPAGVGTPRGEFLKSGDEVRIRIENLGELINRIA